MPASATPQRPAHLVTLVVVITGALAVLAAIAFWPRGDAPDLRREAASYVDAMVSDVETGTCTDPDSDDEQPCRLVTAELTSGPDAGSTVEVEIGDDAEPDVPHLTGGDEVVLLDVASRPDRFRYSFADLPRSTPLGWLAVAFAAVVVVFARRQGVRSLVGLAAGGAVLVAFLAPALVRDEPAVPVVLAAVAAIAFVTLYLAHGFSRGTTVALAGTLVGLALICALALAMALAAQLTGVGDEPARSLRLTDALDLRGLLVAGIVVGALGALDDVAVSQVSIVASLRRANPMLSRGLLYREATRVGRDHVSSTVNTLVLAYAGASLPLLLLFTQGDPPVGRLLTGELVAVEIVRMLVGGIGLVAAAPITTALAALVLGPSPDGGPRERQGWGPGIESPDLDLDLDGEDDEDGSDDDGDTRRGRRRARRRGRRRRADHQDETPLDPV